MTRVLFTGFEPFGGESVNPSWEAAALAAAEPPPGVEAVAVRLPCVFGDALDELRAAVRRTGPELVVCVGQAGGRPNVTLERVAVNVDDAAIPDNAGRRPMDLPVVPGGPAAYFATLPIKACLAAVREAGVPASVSQSAGTFVCNHVFYGLMHLIATDHPGVRGGFVHLPYAPEQVLARAAPSLPVADAARALRVVAATAATRSTDLRLGAGAVA
ncbi:pyroglutamyl-peptidase I [Streptacidiphilus sp. PB12-B1b]|uniref:pyroglutamyl-peptidase I n=1 Tax=Streptacidiphilus sp. PB12-B1b TaxID=2705012 RepID=UPI0015FAFDFC|nr:pyroglutamyl-peptidase I [Streptacidiphilus sp. PB12-B1b]QMU77895.1 pyroglutamyl-peptidase I [Streptacidiphilus sp. PB12-B1b]